MADDQEYQDFLAWKAQQASQAEAARPRELYVHLADGRVETVKADEFDNGTHYDGVQVIGTYEVGA